MDWCGSSTPRTPEYRTMNEERHERKAYWLVIVRPQFLIGGDTKGLCPSIPWLDRNKVQVYRSVRMPQLHTSLHFHLTPIGQRTRRCLGYATGGSGEVGIGEHSSWGGLTTQMLSVVIRSALGYPAFTVGTIIGTLEAPPEGGLLRLPPKLHRKGPKPIPWNNEAS
ncbi:hypothetical protein ACET3Z_001146 [Daucus carota]